MDLNGKVAIVTGGAVRLGRAISLELARHGVRIFCVYNSSKNEALELEKIIRSGEGDIVLHACNLTDLQTHGEIVNHCLESLGQLDILINNAALFYPTPLGTVSEDDWDTFHNLNLKAAFFLSQEAATIMKQSGNGRIVNIGDTNYISPWAAYIPYTLTKAGINAMTVGLAKALAPDVLVNCVNPGPVLLPEDYDDEQNQQAIERTLLKREGTAEDIARTVCFLCETDYITGAAVPVDGGRHVG